MYSDNPHKQSNAINTSYYTLQTKQFNQHILITLKLITPSDVILINGSIPRENQLNCDIVKGPFQGFNM